MDGDHEIDKTADSRKGCQNGGQSGVNGVLLEGTLLKPSMTVPMQSAKLKSPKNSR